jgi:hypothetical protein
MINSLTTHADAGRKAAIARRLHDEAACQFLFDWHTRAVRLETHEDSRKARNAFGQSYTTY